MLSQNIFLRNLFNTFFPDVGFILKRDCESETKSVHYFCNHYFDNTLQNIWLLMYPFMWIMWFMSHVRVTIKKNWVTLDCNNDR